MSETPAKNPWLDIPLADYEAHMALPEVAQAKLLADTLRTLLKEHRPKSLAVLGCAGGNGFDRINPVITKRVVGVDINSSYLKALQSRYEARIPGLQLIAGDILAVSYEPVAMIYAALVLEYVDVSLFFQHMRRLLLPQGLLVTVVQRPGASPVTPSAFQSLETLSSFMHLVDPDDLARLAHAAGFRETENRTLTSQGGKQFEAQLFA